MNIKNKISFWVLVFIVVVFSTLRLSFRPSNIISYDVFGYYLYLPSLIIYDDPGLKDISWVNKINAKYASSPSLYQVSQAEAGNWVIRFYTGIALMYAPFFLVGHLYALCSSYPPDGFSPPYQWAIFISGIFYTLLGVWLMRKLLLRLFNDKIAGITLSLLFIGSNLFFFSTIGNDSPHIYIFTLATALLYLTDRWHISPEKMTAAGIGFLIGLITICRASGILVFLIPLFWGIYDFRSLREKIRLLIKNYSHVLILCGAGLLAVLPQILYWRVITGQFIYNAYDDPQSGFDFANPRILYILFGFRKGLYLYSSMMIFATIGFVSLFKNNRKIFFALLLFFLANVYIIACYSSLVSFGWRAFIETHAILAIPLGYFVASSLKSKKWLRYTLVTVLFLFAGLNLFKTYQTAIGVIDGSRMTKEYYLATFFKAKPTQADCELMLVNRVEASKEHFYGEENYLKKNLTVIDFEDISGNERVNLEDSIVYRGKYSYKLYSSAIYASALMLPYREITQNDHAWIRAGVFVYPTDSMDMDQVLLVIDFKHKGRIYKYRAFNFSDCNIQARPNQWNRLSYDYLTPEVRSTDDILEIYVWYRGKSPCYFDDLTVDAYEKK
jgi:hypothetical protein